MHDVGETDSVLRDATRKLAVTFVGTGDDCDGRHALTLNVFQCRPRGSPPSVGVQGGAALTAARPETRSTGPVLRRVRRRRTAPLRRRARAGIAPPADTASQIAGTPPSSPTPSARTPSTPTWSVWWCVQPPRPLDRESGRLYRINRLNFIWQASPYKESCCCRSATFTSREVIRRGFAIWRWKTKGVTHDKHRYFNELHQPEETKV